MRYYYCLSVVFLDIRLKGMFAGSHVQAVVQDMKPGGLGGKRNVLMTLIRCRVHTQCGYISANRY